MSLGNIAFVKNICDTIRPFRVISVIKGTKIYHGQFRCTQFHLM